MCRPQDSVVMIVSTIIVSGMTEGICSESFAILPTTFCLENINHTFLDLFKDKHNSNNGHLQQSSFTHFAILYSLPFENLVQN